MITEKELQKFESLCAEGKYVGIAYTEASKLIAEIRRLQDRIQELEQQIDDDYRGRY